MTSGQADRPSSRYSGACLVTTSRPDPLGAPKLYIDRADPIVRISADLLQQISINTCRGEDDLASLHDDVLTLRGTNRTVIYRVDFADWDATTDSYRAEWPD